MLALYHYGRIPEIVTYKEKRVGTRAMLAPRALVWFSGWRYSSEHVPRMCRLVLSPQQH